ncbi:hypothetical protein BJF92_23260 [Rhizobium rhizosphaerae]|uniref:Uncharacterized protein n=1 Tax=Xaviernesmea rhizosphaerae TaxID=1672749 RepID=A0A1Q9AJQ9_9HYPH|nr:hypothetical protein [Xaviernesmea rhizosphaerae]OLP55461.1 hypothetical protein BJF92_23260 [Xaviernesmea rhizosphaerae]OQP85562.1 hypothetical protein BTR14_15360 [Xaviernesmea rhizosphaerae]
MTLVPRDAVDLDAAHRDPIALGDRPLVVLDVDDVVLQFLAPFEAFLTSLGHRLVPRSFRLHGNILSSATEEALPDETVSQLILDFFEAQERWQTPFAEAVEALEALSRRADIVFLTAMPPVYALKRRRLLDRLGLCFPLIATESPKGPVVASLHGGRPLPVAFVDDMVYNLSSVASHVPDCLLLHMRPESPMHRHAPETPDPALRARDWREAQRILEAHVGAPADPRVTPI